jgi:hypothetical protein
MEMSSLLALDANDRAIGDFLVGLPVQRHPDRKTDRCVTSNNLNATKIALSNIEDRTGSLRWAPLFATR